MMDRLRTWAAPTYLALCLLLGGSAQGVWGAMALQLSGIAILAWTALDRTTHLRRRGERALGWLLVAGIAIVAIQLIPLPMGMWRSLGGRDLVASGFETLGLSPGWMPLSLSPYDTLTALPAIIPALAMLSATIRFGVPASSKLAMTLIGVTFVAIMVGVAQSSTDNPQAAVYFYAVSNFGSAIGFFANSNHMATLLLVSIPMIVAIGATARDRTTDLRKRTAAIVLTVGGVGVVLVGLALNGSLAGYGLAIPVSVASAIGIHSWGSPVVRRAGLGLAVVGLLAFLVTLFTPAAERIAPIEDGVSLSSRGEILDTTRSAFEEFGLAGTGLGTFAKVYPLFESPSSVDRTFVNHAHNDYAELALELGLAGIMLILAFLAWWVLRAKEVLTIPSADHYAMAATIASATVLVHSAVDYPLRTAAIGAVFAMCLGLMLASRRVASGKNDLRPTRHLVIE